MQWACSAAGRLIQHRSSETSWVQHGRFSTWHISLHRSAHAAGGGTTTVRDSVLLTSSRRLGRGSINNVEAAGKSPGLGCRRQIRVKMRDGVVVEVTFVRSWK